MTTSTPSYDPTRGYLKLEELSDEEGFTVVRELRDFNKKRRSDDNGYASMHVSRHSSTIIVEGMSVNTLLAFAARLHELVLQEPPSYIGRNTAVETSETDEDTEHETEEEPEQQDVPAPGATKLRLKKAGAKAVHTEAPGVTIEAAEA